MDTDFENDECPDGCSIVHEVPPSGTMTCPDTGNMYMFCNPCDEWFDPDDYRENFATVRGGQRIIVCDPNTHNYVHCTRCEGWILASSASEPCYNSDPYCGHCWSEMGGCDCDDCQPPDNYSEYYSTEDPDDEDGEEVNVCPRCGQPDTNLDLLSEMFFCLCAVEEMLKVDPDHPFKTDKDKVYA